MKQFFLITLATFFFNLSFAQPKKNILHLVHNKTKHEYGYLNNAGDTTIPFGKYGFCFTEKFDKFAIVMKDYKFVGIDRQENILFNIFIFDNGPDYPSNGLFRIVINGKIGYADNNGKIVVPAQYDCAYPFKNGKAMVGNGCELKNINEEHLTWVGGKWHYINKKGITVGG
jgi:hypothetical protein